jgi:hypothetical protein
MKTFPSFVLAFGLLTSALLRAAVPSLPIPRSPIQNFVSEGIFKGGGTSQMVNVERIRWSPHKGYERWVIDFSDEPGHRIGTVAPEFQLRYVKAEKVPVPNGEDILLDSPKFVFLLRGIHENHLKKPALQKLVRKSQYVKEIILYPPIEGGDIAVEFLLKDSVLFEPHQPTERVGRLVIDMKNAPLGQ